MTDQRGQPPGRSGTARVPRTRGGDDGVQGPPSEPQLERKEVVTGRQTGNVYVRVHRDRSGLRRLGAGHLEATAEAIRPRSALGRALFNVKGILVGAPLATTQLAHERLSKAKALAVFSSDALSSSAYATEEILLVLFLAGSAGLAMTMPTAIAIALLLAVVAFSYRQTIRAYPNGGGSYIVSKDNLGVWPGLIAAGALTISYILTVAVSISAGVAAISSAIPALADYRVAVALGFIGLITLINLRGVRESGTVFAIPVYFFIVSMGTMIALGVGRYLTGGLEAVPPADATHLTQATEALTAVLVLRAFTSGCAALTGTEAIADGVPAFKPPEWRNAQITLTWMAGILAVLFLGISFLAYELQIIPSHHETVVSQIARAVFGDTPFYYLIQVATMLSLILAANTAFADFPRLSYFLARDHFIPHQFQFRGDRLAFSSGIMALGVISALVVFQFRADTHALIPLYAISVFIAFTMSESGMVRHWWVNREPGWERSLAVNLIGAVVTGMVAIVAGITKFAEGAWMVIVLIPILVLTMRGIYGHYRSVAEQLATSVPLGPLPRIPQPIMLVPVPGLNRAVEHTLAVARSLSPNVTAVHVSDDPDAADRLRQQWAEWSSEIPLVVLDSPFRSLLTPLLVYIDALRQRDPKTPIVVVLSEFVPRHFWEYFLHNQSALRLKAALFFRPNTVVMDVPYHLHR